MSIERPYHNQAHADVFIEGASLLASTLHHDERSRYIVGSYAYTYPDGTVAAYARLPGGDRYHLEVFTSWEDPDVFYPPAPKAGPPLDSALWSQEA